MSEINQRASHSEETAPGADIDLLWLLKLRWFGALGQAMIILVSGFYLGIQLPAFCIAIPVISGATNLFLSQERIRMQTAQASLIFPILLLDTILLTILFLLIGGATNPFSIFYLLYVALGAITLRPFAAWSLAGISVFLYGLLFVMGPAHDHSAEHHLAETQGTFSLHLQGMFFAFSFAALVIAYLVSGLFRALRERESQLKQIREERLKDEKLVSLATLAAGAAHELNTPLSTIAVVAHEMELRFQKDETEGEEMAEDLALIRSEVKRCRDILEKLDEKNQENSVKEHLEIPTLAQEMLAEIPEDLAQRVVFQNESGLSSFWGWRSSTVTVMTNLIRNALEATNQSVQIRVVQGRSGDTLQFLVEDTGTGIPPETFERIGEPFFSTKDTGKGMGLGIFLSQALTRKMGGRLGLQSKLGKGTIACLELPL